MSVNWQDVILALKISGVGIVVLLLVLAVLAGIISLLTRLIKDAPEEEEAEGDDEEVSASPAAMESGADLSKIAAIAVAIARAQSELSITGESSASALNSWGQFHLNRRLNLSSSFRRSK